MAADSSVVIANMALLRASVNKQITLLTDPSTAAQACNAFYESCRDRVLEAYFWPFATRRAQLFPLTGGAYASGTTYAAGQLAYYGGILYRSLTDGNLGNAPNTAVGNWRQVTRDGWAFVCPLPDDFIDNGAQSIYPKPTNSNTVLPPDVRLQPQSGVLRNPRADQRIPFALEDANDGTATGVLLTDLDTPVLKYTSKLTDTKRYSATFISCVAWLLASEIAAPLRSDTDLALKMYKAYLAALAEAIASTNRSQQPDSEPTSEFEGARE